MVKLFHTSWLKNKEYLHWDDDFGYWVVNDDAPEEVKEENRLYWEQMEYYRKREAETGATII